METVRRVYEAMNAGDVGLLTELLHPDAEWIPDRRVGQGPIQGRESMIHFFADRAEMFGGLSTEVERTWQADDRVLVFVRVTGSGDISGAGFDIRIAHLWTVRGGRLVRGEGYGERQEALQAAGLSE